ncbi:hypothetical protein RJ639_013308 [Escallonia herrerae]|uniref:F-box domain-containing protein n=1 Tax=Escallonia herrerae TaxID=1293975 RepID=A0AA88VGM8_9ASTE|nr:hypothetical protein RJ639_013308 [Escallonia herrerae]
MKRPIASGEDPATREDEKKKKIKVMDDQEEVLADGASAVLLDENLLYEVLRHADARTLASAACVSRRWHATARDERLWELICTRQSANIGCGIQQLRSVVLALGGFRVSGLPMFHPCHLRPLDLPQRHPIFNHNVTRSFTVGLLISYKTVHLCHHLYQHKAVSSTIFSILPSSTHPSSPSSPP